jgi:hypothetical protein
MCNVNDYGVNYLCQSLPFGGVNVCLIKAKKGAQQLAGRGRPGCANESLTLVAETESPGSTPISPRSPALTALLALRACVAAA